MNPIINMLNQQNPIMDMLRPLYNAMQASGNPMAAISQMAMQDDRVKQAMNSISLNGGVQGAVYAEAQKRNIDPNEALAQAQQLLQTINMK